MQIKVKVLADCYGFFVNGRSLNIGSSVDTFVKKHRTNKEEVIFEVSNTPPKTLCWVATRIGPSHAWNPEPPETISLYKIGTTPLDLCDKELFYFFGAVPQFLYIHKVNKKK